MIYTLSKKDRSIKGEISLDGSKSISNRALIIRALCREHFDIENISTSRDTETLQKLIAKDSIVYDAGAAGTTFRFMTAYLALQDNVQVLTGSERMKQRPIGVLVDALNQIGADITYLEKPGYPPLQINPPKIKASHRLSIPANISSQFTSALLMIAPILPNGLELSLEGKIVSLPYINMTLGLMKHFGIQHHWKNGNQIIIAPQDYEAKPFKVEADWSAASYYYAMAAFADDLDLQLNGLYEDSTQGDAILTKMMTHFGVSTQFNTKGVHLTKSKQENIPPFHWNFIKCPDIAQSLAVICGGLGVEASFEGLETLKIKETDRVAALHTELKKVQVDFSETSAKDDVQCSVKGQAKLNEPQFSTYEDHRMAMAFAPLAMYDHIKIAEPMVVVKSYPHFYEDLKKIGFEVN